MVGYTNTLGPGFLGSDLTLSLISCVTVDNLLSLPEPVALSMGEE